jgi:probable HAF family extracellular repeat protein
MTNIHGETNRAGRAMHYRAIIVGMGLCLAGAAFAQTTYTVHDLGTFPGAFAAQALGLNSLGVAVGSANVDPGGFHAARFGSPNVDLAAQYGYPSVANAINDSNVAVGMVYRDSQGAATHAAIFTGGRPKDIGTLGGSSSVAAGINNAGMVVGRAATWGGTDRAFTYQVGKSLFMRSLPALGGQYADATAINNDGLIVGSAALPSGFSHAVAWRNGAITDLGTLVPGNLDASSFATAVSSNGLIVGSSTAADGQSHGFLVDAAGAMKDLGMFPGSRTTSPAGVNASGVVIGNARLIVGGYGRRQMPWVLDAAGMADINTRLTTTDWKVVVVRAINDAGQIAGTAAAANGGQHAVLLTPN